MTLHQAHSQLLFALYELYDNREAANIADMVIEHVTGHRRIDRMMNKQMPLGPAMQQQLEGYTSQLLLHTPVQYVLHEAWFAGMKFYVDKNVLIPRPETEELIEFIADYKLQIADYKNPLNPKQTTKNIERKTVKLLDIGTGSGCIPIALKKKFPGWGVHALDISEGALQVAQKNAANLEAPVSFYQVDILKQEEWTALPLFDIIVSNPPYIRQSEALEMQGNVTRFEPHTALFVPDDDALVFYKKIAQFALLHLHPSGLLFFEINENLGAEVCNMLAQYGFTEVELRKDMQAKDRMVKAKKPPINAPEGVYKRLALNLTV